MQKLSRSTLHSYPGDKLVCGPDLFSGRGGERIEKTPADIFNKSLVGVVNVKKSGRISVFGMCSDTHPLFFASQYPNSES